MQAFFLNAYMLNGRKIIYKLNCFDIELHMKKDLKLGDSYVALVIIPWISRVRFDMVYLLRLVSVE